MKKPGRKAPTANHGKRKPRGVAPEDRPGGWLRWLDRESNAFLEMSFPFRQFVWLLIPLMIGAGVWVWRSLSAWA